ncbi:hypothetical protein C2869_01140 [Saccharobesus litoralis]|uniref:Uncharacterized protein n=1 Tax=Saccharobesus litoralis TaxID=2172099 RepID=A0A2S0VLZ3_9ALTE|nr:hypothetical protein [Saccharobesus litoralis]AWB65130.1 hypothetical protein C2869_01140 [Saccharobesus litoralis]
MHFSKLTIIITLAWLAGITTEFVRQSFFSQKNFNPNVQHSISRLSSLTEPLPKANNSNHSLNQNFVATAPATSSETQQTPSITETAHQLRLQNAQLQQQVKQLQQEKAQLQQEKSELLSEKRRLQQQNQLGQNPKLQLNAQASQQLGEQFTPEVVERVIKKHIPQNIQSMIQRQSPSLKQFITGFHQRQKDYEWGYNMQMQITDFITTHDLGVGIEISRVQCKQPHCEIIINELFESSWRPIVDEMRDQVWWQFTRTRTLANRNISAGNRLVYTFLMAENTSE